MRDGFLLVAGVHKLLVVSAKVCGHRLEVFSLVVSTVFVLLLSLQVSVGLSVCHVSSWTVTF